MATVIPTSFPADTVLVTEPYTVESLLKERREARADRYDEVWDGVYIMSPIPGPNHQRIVARLTMIFGQTQIPRNAEVYSGLNVTDRVDDWTKNYRCPDVVVVFPECKAILTDSAIIGGPDFLVEVLSKKDMAPQKLDLYAKVGTRECLYIDVVTHATELYRLNANEMSLIGKSTIDSPIVLVSEVLELSFQAVTVQNEAKVLITNLKNPTQKWFA
jgi:Uma2 family endonuclease